MAYLEQTAAPMVRAKAAIGVVGIHAIIGATLIAGLAVTALPKDPETIFGTVQIPLPPPPPDPVEKKRQDQDIPTATQKTYVPDPYIDINPSRPEISSGDKPLEIGDIDPFAGFDDWDNGTGDDWRALPPPTPPQPVNPPQSIDPIAAKPSNSPGGWITKRDYRTSWINRELVGTAKFRLSVSASGKVQDCQITRSSGHNVLDQATCRLLRRRAKFNAARDNQGNRTSGSYTSAVKWELPE